MHELIELVTTWFTDIQRLDEQTLRQLMKMGAAAQKLLEMKDMLLFKGKNHNNSHDNAAQTPENLIPPTF
jgi:hypothetical protein